jgi:DegV family protein with EDD domain
MDKKIAVIACSNACLDYINHPYDIKIFRSTLHLGDEDYLDYIDIKADDFYKRLEEDSSVFPSSSYMPLGQMIEIYENLVKDGYEKAIVISISGNMSGIVNASRMAANEIEGLEVTVFDSKTVAYPQAMMALRASEMIEEGFDVPEIIKELEYIRDHNNVYFAVNTLTYLVKNGRLSNAAGFIGGALKLKPVLTIDEEGKVVTKDKIRTFKKALNRLLELFYEETEGKDIIPYTIHANNYEARDYLVQQVKEHYPHIKEVEDMPLTAVVGAHAGPKTIGLGYYIKK